MPMPVFDMNGNMVSIEVSEVFAIYKEEKTRRMVVIAECGEYYLPTTIKQVADIMASSGFLQIDKNKIINIAKIKHYENGQVTVDGSTYTVSRRKKSELESLLEDD